MKVARSYYANAGFRLPRMANTPFHMGHFRRASTASVRRRARGAAVVPSAPLPACHSSRLLAAPSSANGKETAFWSSRLTPP